MVWELPPSARRWPLKPVRLNRRPTRTFPLRFDVVESKCFGNVKVKSKGWIFSNNDFPYCHGENMRKRLQRWALRISWCFYLSTIPIFFSSIWSYAAYPEFASCFGFKPRRAMTQMLTRQLWRNLLMLCKARASAGFVRVSCIIWHSFRANLELKNPISSLQW